MAEYMKKSDVIAYIRKEAKEAQSAFEELGGESGIIAEAFEDLANELEDFPATDVAPVRYGMWISVKDKLPEPTYCVLVVGAYGEMEIDALGTDGEWMGMVEDVTHWMPLPHPPKGENDG